MDFTMMSDEEIIGFFHKNGRTCGKLTEVQLSRTFIPAQAKKNNFAFRQLLLLPSILVSLATAAQTITKQPPSTTITPASPKQEYDATFGRMVTVKGHVSETSSSRSVRTVIEITNGRDSLNVFSGQDGNYSIAIFFLPGDSLTITASEAWSDNFSKTMQPLNGNDTLTCDIYLIRSGVAFSIISTSTTLTGDIAVDYHPMSKTRNFFYHLFHPFRFRKSR